MINIPKLVAILNITPDSFYSGSRQINPQAAIKHAQLLQNEGADWLDIGAESTRPEASPIEEEEELKRLLPILAELRNSITIPFSIDTMKPKVALAAIKAGATMINDVTGFENSEMRYVAAENDVLICVMHMQGKPSDMQKNPVYTKSITEFLIDWFSERLEILLKAGVKDKNIIIDPGIGFGKTVADNLEIIENLPKLKDLGFPLYIGLSRKSFIRKILGKSTEELLVATLTMNILAIQKGANYIRVHDVKEHRDVIKSLAAFNDSGNNWLKK